MLFFTDSSEPADRMEWLQEVGIEGRKPLLLYTHFVGGSALSAAEPKKGSTLYCDHRRPLIAYNSIVLCLSGFWCHHCVNNCFSSPSK